MKRPMSTRAVIIFGIMWLSFMYFASDIRPIAIMIGSWKTTTHDQFNFSVEHPSKWVAHRYGEKGWRSEEDLVMKLEMGLAPAFNGVWIMVQENENPSVEDVANWGDEYLNEARQKNRLYYEEISLREEQIQGVPILRRVYKFGSLTNEDVYIARANDMIIIKLRTSQDRYEDYAPDFDRLVKSFSPLE